MGMLSSMASTRLFPAAWNAEDIPLKLLLLLLLLDEPSLLADDSSVDDGGACFFFLGTVAVAFAFCNASFRLGTAACPAALCAAWCTSTNFHVGAGQTAAHRSHKSPRFPARFLPESSVAGSNAPAIASPIPKFK